MQATNPIVYDTDPNMASAMGGAHRKPASKAGVPPSISRHVCFWMPAVEELTACRACLLETNAGSDAYASDPPKTGKVDRQEALLVAAASPEAVHAKARTEWVCEIQLYILSIYDLLCDRSSNPPCGLRPTLTNMLEKAPTREQHDATPTLDLLIHIVPEDRAARKIPGSWKRIEGKTRHEMVRISGTWDGLPIEFTFELHAEYFTLTIRLELASTPEQYELPSADYKHRSLAIEALKCLNEVLTERWDRVCEKKDGSERRGRHRQRLEQAYSVLYDEVWDRLRNEITGSDATQDVDRKRLGRAFGDFRGLLVRTGFTGTPEKKGQYLEMLDPKVDPKRSHRNTLTEIIGARFGDTELVDHADTLLPFLLANPQLQKDDYGRPGHEKLEHTFTGMQNGRCLYASALLSQSPDIGNPHLRPLTYLVLSNHGERWQLGRLVDRLHTMGTLRLAAIRGLHEYSRANAELRTVELRLDEIERHQHGLAQQLQKREGCDSVSYAMQDLYVRIAQATRDDPPHGRKVLPDTGAHAAFEYARRGR